MWTWNRSPRPVAVAVPGQTSSPLVPAPLICSWLHQRGLDVHCCNPAACHHSPQPCLQHIPWTCIFNFVKKKKKNQQQPRRHCCLFSRFSDRPNQQKSGPFCSHCQKNISSTLCCSFPGKTQNSLKCTYFQTATLNQTWDWIYCKRLPLGHESYSNAVSAILSDCSSFTQHPREIYFT